MSTPKTAPAGPPPTRYLIQELERGFRVDQIFLVEEANFKQTRNNKHFIQATLRDRSGSIKGIRWDADQELYSSFQPDEFVRITGRVEEFQQHLQIIIDEIGRVDEGSVPLDAFLPASEFNIGAMEQELRAILGTMQDAHLKNLVQAFLADPEVIHGLRRAPAGKNLHHASIGGLLEHILSLSRAASLLCQNYPQLNRDLLLTGVLLHDIGKIRELSYTTNFRYTDIGQLVGHIGIGISWTAEISRRIAGFPVVLLNQILHLIASHHGELEMGAIKTPMTQEALVLHYLDNLDAKLDIFKTVKREQRLGTPPALKAGQNGGSGPDGQNNGPEGRDGKGSVENWSEWHPAMGRRLYFP